MRSVRADGTRYLLVKQSGDSSLVRNPTTGEERYLPNDDLEPAGGESPLETAARAVPEAARRVLSAVHDDRSLGLLLELDRRGPLAAVDLMGDYDYCESDVHGLLAEFRAAGLVEEATVAGQRGYDTTPLGGEGLAHLRGKDGTDE
ncbi:DUF7346 family protein [Halomarina litorea]|uniref:DUF7346 family protein n=1 Tax=Halomarina litorea TaxID=2961595 RepID=UPI0020C2326C|nr:hypothetical protein [Halomarina sp. BCD28]